MWGTGGSAFQANNVDVATLLDDRVISTEDIKESFAIVSIWATDRIARVAVIATAAIAVSSNDCELCPCLSKDWGSGLT
jgi:hypothetical protein